MTAFGAGLGCGPLLFSLSLSVPPPHIDQGPAAPHLTHHCPARATCPAVSHSFRGGTPSLLATSCSLPAADACHPRHGFNLVEVFVGISCGAAGGGESCYIAWVGLCWLWSPTDCRLPIGRCQQWQVHDHARDLLSCDFPFLSL